MNTALVTMNGTADEDQRNQDRESLRKELPTL